METMYTVRELVKLKLLGYKERAIRQLIATQKLRCVRMRPQGSKQVKILVPESAVREFLEQGVKAASTS